MTAPTPYYEALDWDGVTDTHTGKTYPVSWQRGEPALPVLALLREAIRERTVPSSLYFDPDVADNAEAALRTADLPLLSPFFRGSYEGGLVSRARAATLVSSCTNYWRGMLLTSIMNNDGHTGATALRLNPDNVDWTGLMPTGYAGLPAGMIATPLELAQRAGYTSVLDWRSGTTPFPSATFPASKAVFVRDILKQIYCYAYGNLDSAEHWGDMVWAQTLEYESKFFETDPPYQGDGTWQECMDGFDATPWTPCASGNPHVWVSYRNDNETGGYDGASWAASALRIKGGTLKIGGDDVDKTCQARVFVYPQFYESPPYDETDFYPYICLANSLCVNEVTVPQFEPAHPSTLDLSRMPAEGIPGDWWRTGWSWHQLHMTVDFKVAGGFVLI